MELTVYIHGTMKPSNGEELIDTLEHLAEQMDNLRGDGEFNGEVTIVGELFGQAKLTL